MKLSKWPIVGTGLGAVLVADFAAKGGADFAAEAGTDCRFSSAGSELSVPDDLLPSMVISLTMTSVV